MRGYFARVRMMLAKLLLVFAMLLMPLGMAPAAAAHHRTMAGMQMEHCPDQKSDHHSGGITECTMVCAPALPAAAASTPERAFVARQPVALVLVERLHGLHPETATPPPKLS